MRRLLRTIARGRKSPKTSQHSKIPQSSDQLLGVERGEGSRAQGQGEKARGHEEACDGQRATGGRQEAGFAEAAGGGQEACGGQETCGEQWAADGGKKRTALRNPRPARKRRRG